MKNHIQEPLICLGMYPNNNAKPAANTPAKVTIEERKLASGSWECVGYVNGKPITSVSSKDKAYNRREVISDLAEGGYYLPKQLAPVMSARMPKKSTRNAA